MLIQTGASAPACHPSPRSHHHGKCLVPMEAVHVAHDVAMIGMSWPGFGHSPLMLLDGSFCGTPPERGTFDAFVEGGAVNQGLTLVSAAAAVGATYHGARMLRQGHYAHGANHVLMGAASGVMALAMATGNHTLHQASSALMAAHGALEVGLGASAFLKAGDAKSKAFAATTAVHGACLAAAQLTNNATLAVPLYLGMGTATAVQLALGHS